MPPRWFRILVFLFALATYGSTVRAQSTLIPLSSGMSEMVFDHSGKHLYVTVPGWLVRRYNLTTHQFDLDYNLGGSVSSIDIAPDDSCLLVTQDIPANAQGIVHRIDLRTGAVVNLSYDLINYPNYQVGAWVVRIASDGLAFVIGNLYGLAGGTVPLRQIDLATNTISVRSDVDWPMFASDISRSADATVLYITEPQVSNNPVLTYDAKTNSFSAVISTNLTLFYNTNAVSRDGTLLATTLLDYGVSLDRFSNFSYVHNFPPAPETSLESSVVFDPKSDTMYWVRSSTQQIVAYDTNTFAEKFRWDIGEWVGGASGYWVPFVASPDGRYLALGTQSGIRACRLPGPTQAPRGFVYTVR